MGLKGGIRRPPHVRAPWAAPTSPTVQASMGPTSLSQGERTVSFVEGMARLRFVDGLAHQVESLNQSQPCDAGPFDRCNRGGGRGRRVGGHAQLGSGGGCSSDAWTFGPRLVFASWDEVADLEARRVALEHYDDVHGEPTDADSVERSTVATRCRRPR